ncbi:MAG: ABC transporter permease subunit [Cellulosilyticaceae bacterium]
MNEKTWKKIWDILVVFAVFNIIILFVIYKNPDFTINAEAVERYGHLLLQGYGQTILISIVSLFLSLGFSGILFGMSISKHTSLKYFYNVLTQIGLGVPLMVHVIVLYFFLTSAMGIKDPLIGGTLILSLYMACYFAKTFEGAYHAIAPQQFKMMHMLQLPRSVCMGKIIVPQMIRSTLPTLTSHFALLVKSTALLSLISVPEFTQFVNLFNSRTLEFVTGYVLLAVGYLTITIPLSLCANWLNKRMVNL